MSLIAESIFFFFTGVTTGFSSLSEEIILMELLLLFLDVFELCDRLMLLDEEL
jgi:hypothetical protein